MLALRCVQQGTRIPGEKPLWRVGRVYPIEQHRDPLTGQEDLRWVVVEDENHARKIIDRASDGGYFYSLFGVRFELTLHGGE